MEFFDGFGAFAFALGGDCWVGDQHVVAVGKAGGGQLWVDGGDGVALGK